MLWIILFTTFAQAQQAPALKELKGCDSLASLEAVKQIDTKEVQLNEMRPRVSQQLDIAAGQTGEPKSRMCEALRTKALQYASLATEIHKDLVGAAKHAKNLGVSSCAEAMQKDAQDSMQTAQNMQLKYNQICAQ